MPVTVKEETRLFIIETDHSEYQLMADEYGILRHLWYGEKVGMSMEYLCVYPLPFPRTSTAQSAQKTLCRRSR